MRQFHSGATGRWQLLGPWHTVSKEGTIKLSARGGAVNLSGVELWRDDGRIPDPPAPEFLDAPTSDQIAFFERKIRPLLVEHCYECHSASAESIKGGLSLDSRAGIIKGGDTGPAITPGRPGSSLLIQAVRHIDPDLSMPPKTKLSSEDVANLEEWIRMGVPDPRTENTIAQTQLNSDMDWEDARKFWSFRPIVRPPLPSVGDASWPMNGIDRFILASLEEVGLKPAEQADKRILLRRATFDLTGLPPTSEELESFLNDDSPSAFARVVDRLLDSPKYGERWGRYWLDVVRYADTAGDNSDFPIPQHYRYRDWVISAFNRDMPYDQFVREQLAGDLLESRDMAERHQRIIATGYIANARRFGSRVHDYPQHLTIEDTIDNLGRSFLGLTVSCARCHDHKFDPITAKDYYALYGIFHSTQYPWPGIELEQKQRDFIPLAPDSQVKAATTAHREKQEQLEAAVARLEEEIKSAESEKKEALQRALEQAKKAVDIHKRTPLPIDQAYAVRDASRIENVRIHQKGDPAKPGPVVRRGFLTVLNGAELPPNMKTSGRLELSQWIVDRSNPLTARVMANRIWLGHFGKGIVPTPNDFGRQGKPPTHPELLDWLAVEFMESNWSIKSMHRLIMLSRTYQQSSELSPDALGRDPNNELLSAFPRRRLEAEAIRDTLILLANNLDQQPGAEHPFPPRTEWKFTQHNPFRAVYETNRRSVYLMTQRIQRHPYLAIFDGADPATSTPMRTTSTTPLQALYLLNNGFVHEQAQQFARRLFAGGDSEHERLNQAYILALARPPDAVEQKSAMAFLSEVRQVLQQNGTPARDVELKAWEALLRVIFRLNEFVYLD